MRELGLGRALVAADGDIALGLPPPGQAGWRIEIEAEGLLAEERVLVISEAGVSTSGDAWQHLPAGGRRIAHVIDPRVREPLVDPGQVTVIAPDAATSDSLATAALVLGPEAGAALLRRTPGCRAPCAIARSTWPAPNTWRATRDA